jgi:hypothetical protein
MNAIDEVEFDVRKYWADKASLGIDVVVWGAVARRTHEHILARRDDIRRLAGKGGVDGKVVTFWKNAAQTGKEEPLDLVVTMEFVCETHRYLLALDAIVRTLTAERDEKIFSAWGM